MCYYSLEIQINSAFQLIKLRNPLDEFRGFHDGFITFCIWSFLNLTYNDEINKSIEKKREIINKMTEINKTAKFKYKHS